MLGNQSISQHYYYHYYHARHSQMHRKTQQQINTWIEDDNAAYFIDLRSVDLYFNTQAFKIRDHGAPCHSCSLSVYAVHTRS